MLQTSCILLGLECRCNAVEMKMVCFEPDDESERRCFSISDTGILLQTGVEPMTLRLVLWMDDLPLSYGRLTVATPLDL